MTDEPLPAADWAFIAGAYGGTANRLADSLRAILDDDDSNEAVLAYEATARRALGDLARLHAKVERRLGLTDAPQSGPCATGETPDPSSRTADTTEP